MIEVCFNILGAVMGVFDHNVSEGEPWWHTDGNQRDDWDDRTFEFGTTNSFYIEDNLYIGEWGIAGAGWGGRYVARYNHQVLAGANSLFPWFDIHGNQGGGVYAARGAEIYGNTLNAATVPFGNGVKAFHHRGAKALIFGNRIVGPDGDAIFEDASNTAIHLQEEYTDSISPTDAGASDPQHVNGSYYWNNRNGATNGSLMLLRVQNDGTSTDTIDVNVDYWLHTTSFNGTVGMGTGTLAARPATATTGVGYWATDQATTSVPAVSSGIEPTVPIEGTLYVATSTDTWTAFYTPLTYPHPMITAQDGGGGISGASDVNITELRIGTIQVAP